MKPLKITKYIIFDFTKEKGAFDMNGGGIIWWARRDRSQIAKIENAMADYATERKCDIAMGAQLRGHWAHGGTYDRGVI